MKHLITAIFCFLVLAVSTPAQACYTAFADLVRVVDGDTFEVELSLWHGLKQRDRIRLENADTPDIRRMGDKLPDKMKAAEATVFAAAWLKQGIFKVVSCRKDGFRRPLVRVSRGESDLGEELKKHKLAVVWKRG